MKASPVLKVLFFAGILVLEEAAPASTSIKPIPHLQDVLIELARLKSGESLQSLGKEINFVKSVSRFLGSAYANFICGSSYTPHQEDLFQAVDDTVAFFLAEKKDKNFGNVLRSFSDVVDVLSRCSDDLAGNIRDIIQKVADTFDRIETDKDLSAGHFIRTLSRVIDNFFHTNEVISTYGDQIAFFIDYYDDHHKEEKFGDYLQDIVYELSQSYGKGLNLSLLEEAILPLADLEDYFANGLKFENFEDIVRFVNGFLNASSRGVGVFFTNYISKIVTFLSNYYKELSHFHEISPELERATSVKENVHKDIMNLSSVVCCH